MDHRLRLKELLVERSVRLGDFTLASGARSSYYVDARRTTMSAEGQMLVGRLAFDAIVASELNVTHVGGLTMGADPVAYAIAHRSWLDGRPLDAFSVRKKAKQHGTGQRIEGGLPRDAACLVIEDSMTTGNSALEAVSVLRAFGARPLGVLTVVDRQEGGRERLEAEGLPLIALFSGPELLKEAQSRSRSGMTRQR
ncbi:MAG: orotate phosphoribosyltransferase [Gemmatimonadota bacterium]